MPLDHLARDGRGERQAQHRGEDRIGPFEPEVERIAARDDAGDHAVRAGEHPPHADDAAVEVAARRSDLVEPFHRVLEIGGGDVAAQRRGEPGVAAHLEAVQGAALAHLGQALGQLRDQARAGQARLVRVLEQGAEHRLDDRPGVAAVGQRRIEEVGIFLAHEHRVAAAVPRAFERRAGRIGGGRRAAGAARHGEEQREGEPATHRYAVFSASTSFVTALLASPNSISVRGS